MPTKEGIREEIKAIIEAEARNGYLWDFCEFANTATEDVVEDYLYKLADLVMEKESSQGVVIKVAEISEDLAQTASESPKYFAQGKDIALISTERTFHIFKNFKDMGYVAVEPLIEDE